MDNDRKFKADGDTWSVRLGERSRREGYRSLLFFCTTTNQRPYRVVEVPAEEFSDPEILGQLDNAALLELFHASRSLGYPLEYE